jgi:hypothetical protein
MHGWFLIQTFYHGLKRTSHEHLDTTIEGAFFSLQVPAAKELIEKMVANQGWDRDRLQPRTQGVHQVDGIDMITTKMDLLMKKLEASTNMETAKIMEAHMTCEVCGNVGHSGNDSLLDFPPKATHKMCCNMPYLVAIDTIATKLFRGPWAAKSHVALGYYDVVHLVVAKVFFVAT